MPKKVIYVDDANTGYEVSIDNDDARVTVDGVLAFTDTAKGTPVIPIALKMRYVNTVLVSNFKIRRRFFIGSPGAKIKALQGKILLGVPLPSSGITGGQLLQWRITSFRGESRSIRKPP